MFCCVLLSLAALVITIQYQEATFQYQHGMRAIPRTFQDHHKYF